MPINKVARNLIRRFGCNVFIETGIHESETYNMVYRWFERFDEDFKNKKPSKFRMYEVDLDPRYASNAYESHKDNPNCNVYCNSSEQFLNQLAATIDFTNDSVFVFLDAHWNSYWPLLDELEAVKRIQCKQLIVLVDDYKTPGRPYNYDGYNGHECSTEYVSPVVSDRVESVWICDSPTLTIAGYRTVGCLFFDMPDEKVARKLSGLSFIADPIRR